MKPLKSSKIARLLFAAVLIPALALPLSLTGAAEEAPFVPGETVYLGSYPAGNPLVPEDLSWQVLAVQGDQALLITSSCIDARSYNDTLKDLTWEESDVRQWLNTSFLEGSFSPEERELIMPVILDNPDSRQYPTFGGNATEDRVFLLSNDEVLQYFPEEASRACAPSPAAVNHGARKDRDNGNTGWWTRSPGFFQGYASYVLSTGTLGEIGHFADYENNTVRPAVWVSIKQP
ncbi:DUF6273 domain-containing protein [Succinimonas sp.]|uniref:DUF6273 domain-containing protein n=1 Tax=Succinimonas sp. TaxID=1936151 RepID=UPI0038636947